MTIFKIKQSMYVLFHVPVFAEVIGQMFLKPLMFSF